MLQFRFHIHIDEFVRRISEMIAKPEQALYIWPAIHESAGALKASFGRSDYQTAKGLHEVTCRAGANPITSNKKIFNHDVGAGPVNTLRFVK